MTWQSYKIGGWIGKNFFDACSKIGHGFVVYFPGSRVFWKFSPVVSVVDFCLELFVTSRIFQEVVSLGIKHDARSFWTSWNIDWCVSKTSSCGNVAGDFFWLVMIFSTRSPCMSSGCLSLLLTFAAVISAMILAGGQYSRWVGQVDTHQNPYPTRNS